MTSMGVSLNEDAMDEALKLVRGSHQPRIVDDPQRPEPRRVRPQPEAPAAHPQTAEWLACERKRRNLEAELKTLVSRQDRLRQQILERWSMDGTSQEKVQGQTVHLRRKAYPKVADASAFVKAAIKEGREFLLTVDTKTLAVWATTKEEEGEPLPPSLAACLGESFERFDIAVRLRGSDQ